MSYWEYPEYVSVAEKQARAEKKLKQLQKKMPDIRPVRLTGNSLARTWWAKNWNKNLERYADYSNRIGRGRSYLRHGAVLDLKISAGKVSALVMGSESNPYQVEITIKPLSALHWQALKGRCEGHLKSLQDLLAGSFPKALAEIFFDREQGLFPEPKAIRFYCSCPDSASMCKHVAATLYGIGARFDEDPSLFFTLRGVKSEELISEAIRDTTDALLNKSKQKGGKVIADADLADIFGIDLDNLPEFAATAKKPGKQTPDAAKPASKPSGTKKQTGRGRPAASSSAAARPKKAQSPAKTATAQVVAIITAGSAGVSIAELAAQTGYPKTTLYGIVHRLKKEGVIKNAAHGVYVQA